MTTRSVGVISDTHRMVRPEALTALAGVEQIIHAGDIGAQSVIEQLLTIAPVTAVRGNVDAGEWSLQYPETAVVASGETLIYVIHDLKNLDLDPHVAGFSVVVYGHSHAPRQEVDKGVLFFNPGSAGPRRFHLPVSVGRLTLDEDGKISGEIIYL